MFPKGLSMRALFYLPFAWKKVPEGVKKIHFKMQKVKCKRQKMDHSDVVGS